MKNRAKILTLLSLFFLLLPLIISAGSVPDTGQTKCYDNTAEIPCPQPGDPFYGQDGNYAINPPSYTKLDANGNDLPDSATSWTMVRDNVTALIWEVKTDDGTIHDKDNLYTWCDTNTDTNGGNAGTCGEGTDTEDFINTLNAQNFGGFSDWRLPTIKELPSLVNSAIPGPGPRIDAAWFPRTVSSGYWSSSTYANNMNSAWLVYFSNGSVNYNNKSDGYYVRAVRLWQ